VNPRRPSLTEWAVFCAKMEVAAREFADGDAGRSDSAVGTRRALQAIEEVMQQCGFPSDQWNIVHRLGLALADLKQGRSVPPLLQPLDDSGSGRPPLARDLLAQRAIIAALLDECLSRRRFDSLKLAADWVVRRAGKLPSFQGLRGPPWRAVIRWREEASAASLDVDVRRGVFEEVRRRLAVPEARALSVDEIGRQTVALAAAYGGPIRPEI
jgi:hypothetical protein